MIKVLNAQDGETKSLDIVAENIEKMKSLFPESVVEGKIDFDVLKQLLGSTVEEDEEKYGLNWHGKRRARQIALAPSAGTLRPCPEESLEWDATRNLMIEGDNLEVLKLLQKSYAGKIKLIYIDPPYNTGKDFIYPDDFRDSIRNYLELTGQIDGVGRKLTSNSDTSGRYHTDWLNMMYPRLKLARNLLSHEGIILISIDDHEIDNLRRMCAEVFGEENFCAQFIWNTEGNTDNQYHVKVNHEYVLAYYRDSECRDQAVGRVIDPNTPQESNLWKGVADNNVNKNNPENPPQILELPAGFPCSEETLFYEKKIVDERFFEITNREGFISDSIKSEYRLESKSGLPVKLDDLVVDNYKLVRPCRIYGGMANRNKLLEFIQSGCQPIVDEGTPLRFYLNVNSGVRYHRENDSPRNILSVLRNFGTTEKTRTYLKKLGIYYDYPKPVPLIEYLVRVGCGRDGTVLDFFAGSATTAEAVCNLNASQDIRRRFICVQLPSSSSPSEKSDDGTSANLTSIAKSRLKAVIASIRSQNPDIAGDIGFRVFKLATSNIRSWEPDRTDLGQTLLNSVDHIIAGRTEQDVLYELLLKLGLDLCVPIETRSIVGKDVHAVGGGVLFVSLPTSISREEAEPLALGIIEWHKGLAPAGEVTCVFRDGAFADDVAKTNLAAILAQNGLHNLRSL
jgi:adenine-specific DNA-methyltransferase